MNKGLEEIIKGLEENIKGLEENTKGLEEAILDNKKIIDSLKMLAAVEELKREVKEVKEECRIASEIPKPELPKTEYEYILDLVKDVSDVVYNEFKIMTWSASVSVDTFHKPLQHTAYKRYVIKYNVYERSVIKYNIYERSMALMDNYWDIDPLTTKAFEQAFLYDLIKTLIEKLKDAGFTVHRYVDEHQGLTCGDTHIIEVWRG